MSSHAVRLHKHNSMRLTKCSINACPCIYALETHIQQFASTVRGQIIGGKYLSVKLSPKTVDDDTAAWTLSATLLGQEGLVARYMRKSLYECTVTKKVAAHQKRFLPQYVKI